MENLGCITNPEHEIFKILQPFRNLAIDEVVQRKGDSDTIYSQKTQPFWHQNSQTLQPNRLHESLHGKGQIMHGTTLDSNSRQSDKTYKETEGCGHKMYMESFLSFPELFNDMIKNYFLWNCQTKQEAHTGGSMMQDSETEIGGTFK
jgi:hypothetical protein